MYFLYGSPKTIGIPFSNQKIISIKKSNNGDYFAVITESSLILYSGGHERVILGYYTRSVESVTHDGANEEIYWRHSGDIMLITCFGIAYFLEIKEDENEESDLLDYEFSEETYYVKLESIKPVTINLLGTFSLSNTGVAFFYEIEDKMFTCSKDGYIQRWKKDKNQFMLEEETSICSLEQEIVHVDTHKITDTLMSSPRKSVNGELNEIDNVEVKKLMHEDLYISDITYSPELNMFGVCLKNGRCFILFGDIYSSLKNMKILLLPFNGTTTISINFKRRLIAIGLNDGYVLLINESQNFQIERLISLNPWGITSDMTGKVRNLKWSPDNNVLAVSYDCPGFSIWSCYGCRLNSTISKTEMYNNKGLIESNSITNNVGSCLVWGNEGYHLLVPSLINNQSVVKQYSFVKSCIAANINLNYCHRILLQGDNYLLHLYNKFEESGELLWKQIWYPTIYLKDNWPIKYVSLSKDGNSIAISGKRGFCIYNIPTSKWTIFGDVNEEQSIKCCGLCWYKDSVIITNHDISSNQYEIIFFPKTRLSFSYIQCREVIPKNRKPHYLDCNESTLILFTTDSFFYQFDIDSSGENDKLKFHLKLTQQISIERERHNPQSILLLPYNVNVSSEYDSNKTNLLVLDNSGVLTLCNADKSVDIPIAYSVEQFWLANYELEYLGNTMWAYGESGLEVWYPFFSSPTNELQSFSFLSRGRSLEFDVEVYPIGFLPHEAIIVGLCQNAKYSHTHNETIYDLKTTTEPFLHSVLMRMIRNGNIKDSILMAQKYSFLPHFTHSLELLLHEALEEFFNNSSLKLNIGNHDQKSEDIPKVNLSQQKLERFSTIVNFIKTFEMSIFSEAVVFCARKTDPNMWHVLFHPEKGAGSPRYLFEHCINNENVVIASSYLRVLQIMEDDEYTKEAGLKCLDLCLKHNNKELYDDLMRFFIIRDIEPSNLDHYENQFKEENKDEQYDCIDDIIVENFL